jgi:isoleucyl-tRNA synthetase
VEDRFRETISTRLYGEQSLKENCKEPFVIHDGPPFANGNLHIGHALNKMIKDTILRTKIEAGYRVEFRPGWDCHGMPIELKALASLPKTSTDPASIRKASREFALNAHIAQKTDMQRWGLLADYERPVLTMQSEYQSSQLYVFAKFVEMGLVKRGKKPVHYSPSSKTALADAELEYNDNHISKACLVAFPLLGGEKLLIWTTTPWTVPANQAIGINPNLQYVRTKIDGQTFILAESRVSFIGEITGKPVEIISVVSIEELLSLRYRDFMNDEQLNPILAADFVTKDTGTGLVHLAPAYGHDDFTICRFHGIREREIIDTSGRFTNLAPAELYGRCVIGDGVQAAVELLLKRSMLIHCYDHKHRYPYDWRTKKPVIQMATDQWFINVESILNKVIQAITNVKFVPEHGKKRLLDMVMGRKEWCISRQRYWGVPIPVFYDSNDTPLLNADIVRHVADIFKRDGPESWWQKDASALLPAQYMSKHYRKGTDTLDVWFDSGTFWNINPSKPADLYVEGNDQYRGWFQSSLITSVVARDVAPFKKLVSHGFVLDERGLKMSKSIGNVIDPNDLIQTMKGTDVLRLWAVSSHFQNDVTIGPNSLGKRMGRLPAYIVEQIAELHQKVRNTFRFILGNISDYSSGGFISDERFHLDRCVEMRLGQLMNQMQGLYEQLDFANAITLLRKFITEELSAFYLDVIKNRLYIEQRNSAERRSAQCTLFNLATGMLSVLRPVMPYLCAEVESHLSNHTFKLPESAETVLSLEDIEVFRRSIQIHINQLVLDKLVDSTFQIEASITLTRPLPLSLDELSEILMISKVDTKTRSDIPLLELDAQLSSTPMHIRLYKSRKHKCPRCWVYRMAILSDEVCPPCQIVLNDSLQTNHQVTLY